MHPSATGCDPVPRSTSRTTRAGAGEAETAPAGPLRRFLEWFSLTKRSSATRAPDLSGPPACPRVPRAGAGSSRRCRRMTPGMMRAPVAPPCRLGQTSSISGVDPSNALSPCGSGSREPEQNNLKNDLARHPARPGDGGDGRLGSGKSSWPSTPSLPRAMALHQSSRPTPACSSSATAPDVDRIEHIRPAIALEQKNPVRTARSTVGTATELTTTSGLLFAKVRPSTAPRCGSEARSDSASAWRMSLIRDRPPPAPWCCFPPPPPRPDVRGLPGHSSSGASLRIKVGDLVLDLAEAQVPGVLPP